MTPARYNAPFHMYDTKLPSGKAKILASCSNGSVQLVSESLVTLILGKVELCDYGQ